MVRSPNYIHDPLTASKNVWERGNRQAASNGAVMRCSASAFVHFNDVDKVKISRYLVQLKSVSQIDTSFTLFPCYFFLNLRKIDFNLNRLDQQLN